MWVLLFLFQGIEQKTRESHRENSCCKNHPSFFFCSTPRLGFFGIACGPCDIESDEREKTTTGRKWATKQKCHGKSTADWIFGPIGIPFSWKRKAFLPRRFGGFTSESNRFPILVGKCIMFKMEMQMKTLFGNKLSASPVHVAVLPCFFLFRCVHCKICKEHNHTVTAIS